MPKGKRSAADVAESVGDSIVNYPSEATKAFFSGLAAKPNPGPKPESTSKHLKVPDDWYKGYGQGRREAGKTKRKKRSIKR
jgi:hypothetical protein